MKKTLTLISTFATLTAFTPVMGQQQRPLDLTLPPNTATQSESYEVENQEENPFSEYRFFAWITARVGAKIFTNGEVLDHIEDVILTETQRMALFNSVDGNFDRYKEEVRRRAMENDGALYNYALREITYAEMIKRDSLTYQRREANRARQESSNILSRIFGGGNSSTNSQPQRRAVAFTTTTSQFNEAFQNYKRGFIGAYLDEGLGIVRARQLFGEQLQELGFPHHQGESAEEVYWRWYNSSRDRLTFEMLSNEVRKWENYQARKYDNDLYIRPVEIHDFHTEVSQQIEREFKNSTMNQEQLQDYLENNPHIMAILDNTRVVSPQTMAMGQIKQDYRNNQFIDFYRLSDNLNDNFEQSSENFVENVLSYESRSEILASRYQSAQELRELSREYDLRSSDGELMLSRLYAMAASHHDQGHANKRDQMRAQVREILSEALPSVRENILDQLRETSIFDREQYSELFFHQVVSQSFASERRQLLEQYSSVLDESQHRYLAQSLFMAEFLIRTQAKNAAEQIPLAIDAEICTYRTFDCQDSIEEHLKQEKYKQNLRDYYHTRLSRDFDYRVEITFEDQTRLNGQEAFEYILPEID